MTGTTVYRFPNRENYYGPSFFTLALSFLPTSTPGRVEPRCLWEICTVFDSLALCIPVSVYCLPFRPSYLGRFANWAEINPSEVLTLRMVAGIPFCSTLIPTNLHHRLISLFHLIISTFDIATGGSDPTEHTRCDSPDRFDATTPASPHP